MIKTAGAAKLALWRRAGGTGETVHTEHTIEEARVTTSPGEGRIVVGVDGSEASLEALRWALRQAALTGATVEAITSWQLPAVYGWDGATIPADLDLESNARALQRQALVEVLGPDGADGADGVQARVVQGNPARVLLDAARGADLLILGNRGHGGFTEALLGSVGQHCTQHATCPVLIIPAHH